MEEGMNLWLLNYFPILSSFIPLLAFLAPIIGGGELGVIAVVFLFAKNSSTFWIITISSFIGMVTTDSIWFFIARSKLFIKIKGWKKISKQYKNIEKDIERLSHGKDVLIISLAKILVGTRILLILYIGARDISFRRYIAYNSIVNFLWAILLALIGVAAVKGFNSIIAIFRNVQLGITFLIVVFVVLYILQRWISQTLIKKQKA